MEFKVKSKSQFIDKLNLISTTSGVDYNGIKTLDCDGYYIVDVPDGFINELKTKPEYFYNELTALII